MSPHDYLLCAIDAALDNAHDMHDLDREHEDEYAIGVIVCAVMEGPAHEPSDSGYFECIEEQGFPVEPYTRGDLRPYLLGAVADRVDTLWATGPPQAG